MVVELQDRQEDWEATDHSLRLCVNIWKWDGLYSVVSQRTNKKDISSHVCGDKTRCLDQNMVFLQT